MYYIYYVVKHYGDFLYLEENGNYDEFVGMEILDCDLTEARKKLHESEFKMKGIIGDHVDEYSLSYANPFINSSIKCVVLKLYDEDNIALYQTEDVRVKEYLLDYYMKPYRKTYKKFYRRTPWQWLKDQFYISPDDLVLLFLKAVVTLIVIAPACLVIFKMKSCQEEFKEKERQQWMESYNKYNPITPPANVDIRPTDDYKLARKEFLEQIKENYSTERYEHTRAKVTARIDKDTLWLFAQNYTDPTNRTCVYNDGAMMNAFKICKFAKVNLSTCDAGGNPVWTIYIAP